MPQVELIYDHNCPNKDAARAQLLRAFSETGLTPEWREWERQDSASPAYVQQYGSPTILVNGHDVSGDQEMDAAARCRLYVDEAGQMTRVPPVKRIATALQNGFTTGRKSKGTSRPRWSWRRVVALIPIIGAALLPKLVCPACWPAYAGLLSALGLGFVNYTPYLLPLLLVFLGVTLFSLGYRAPRRRGYKPLALGLIASLGLVVSKFVFESDWGLYGGLAVLIAASVWNAWPQRTDSAVGPPECCETTSKSSREKGGETQ